ncbi:hypothetical protein QDR37_07690 [Amnibacterium sp. CER49]|uniref:NAD(P)H-dependent glycerol-3-phosphate dehydrogenase n=1 Tax=Amnibacterium sp. CER49 TaxID=3039161 RepID=UPI002446B95B|nr:NAD(P)H-dependent glycerol-3-phosphate dehydrogenase [Amnibacterium sp. CER49]MDH2443820.1 hypothetical protein [Amnibacterium sp. CER49]
MTVVTILGAGAMGSALATPLRVRGHEVRLWGTHLDDALLAAVEAGRPHPRTGVPAPEGVRTFPAPRLADALHGADLAVLAVSSEGVRGTIAQAAPALDGVPLLGITSKGLLRDGDGPVRILPDVVGEALAGLSRPPALVGIGGPCKANEVAAARPTATVYGASCVEAARAAARIAQTDDYRVAVTDDLVGLELAAPLKNVYAIALGVLDGLTARGGEPWHDLKSAVFAQAVAEMAALAVAAGGRAETVQGLAGTGDLQVTALSGRNRAYGERLGRGERAAEALAAMAAAEQTVEGVPALRMATALAAQLLPAEAVPLLGAIEALVDGAADPAGRLAAAALPAPVR